ncbi:MAG TPA: DUF2461 domain-containing protein [Bacteroidia bacterium]|jgi:uncharacterized protein (TIGR02453 family)|nr:DUF2461 domain-containing protein [Bacteroidia bacterium]
MKTIPKSSFDFLRQLEKHNDRDWFSKNKHIYVREHEHIVAFADTLLFEMNKHDVIETAGGKKAVYRIYRDVRFSKNKTPYRTHFGGFFKRATAARRGSYYFHLEPGNSYAGGGFWGPEANDLKRIRDEFVYDAKPFRKILASKKFRDTFGELKGDKLKTAPKGFDRNDPSIDLIRHNQFLLLKNFSDKEVMSKNFLKELNATFKAMRPFLDYMSEVLTTDTNGISILK